MGKVWKNGGDEDKFIEKLIKKGKVHKFTKPSALKAQYTAMFGEFTGKVIRNHLNLLKRSNGLYLEEENDDDSEENETKQDETLNVHDFHTAKTSDVIMSGFDSITHLNYPIICEVYKDPENQCEKVAMVITLPAGSEDVKIEITDNGATASITYRWSKTMFDMQDLHMKLLATKHLNIHHPRILCIINGLEKHRQRIDAAPEGVINVTLPVRVQTASDSWSKSGIKRQDGTQILMADFTGYVKNYNIKLIDTSVQFD